MIQFPAWGATVKIWPGEILGLAMIVFVIAYFWLASRDEHNPINFGSMFVWPGTKQTSMAMFLAFCGGMTGLWILIDREFRNTLDATVFLGALSIYIGGKGLTEWINAWRARGNPPPAAGPQYVGAADTVVQTPAPPPAPTPLPIVAAPPPTPARKKRKRTKR